MGRGPPFNNNKRAIFYYINLKRIRIPSHNLKETITTTHFSQTCKRKGKPISHRREKIMETCFFPIAPLLPSSPPLLTASKHPQFPISTPKPHQTLTKHHPSTPISATLKSPKGFGPSPKKTRNTQKPKKDYKNDDDEEEKEEEEEEEEGVIPEIVTNRMIKRIGLSVGVPLFVGLLFFPFFYYLKVGLKIDVPTWVPFIVSFIFFGTALLGVSYGIVSSSWDPMREGSLLGWKEARKNWPVFWQSLRGGSRN